MKKIISTILIVLIAGYGVFFYNPQKAGASWLSDYAYRKEITITGQTGAGTDYQVKFSVATSTGGDFHLEGNAENFPGDLRFTDNDETTELDYWINTSTAPYTFWVEVADSLESTTTIFVYYGKSGATTTMNGSSTFIFFDDFNDASIDATKWTKDVELGAISETGGYLRCGGGSTGAPYGHTSLGSEVGYSGFTTTSVMFRARSSINGIGEMAFRGDYGTNAGFKARFDARAGANGNAFLEPPYATWGFSDGSGTCTSDSDVPTVNQWYKYEIKAVATNLKLYRDDVLKRDCTDASYTAAGEIALQNHYGDNTDYDWVAVKKTQTTEPAFSSAGSEEGAPASGSGKGYIKIDKGRIKIDKGRVIIN